MLHLIRVKPKYIVYVEEKHSDGSILPGMVMSAMDEVLKQNKELSISLVKMYIMKI